VSPNGKILRTNWANIGPHLGFAYKAKESLVVRGGFGIVYDNWAGVLQTAQNISGLWPDIGQQEAVGLNAPTSSSPTPTVTAQNPFAIAANNNFFPAPTPFGQVGFEYDPNLKDPYVEQWNFGVQKLINSSTTLTVNYVGSSMHRLDVGGTYNGALTPGFHTECPTPFQTPLMSEATGFTVSKAAFRRMPTTRLALIGLCQDLI
jgi:hypothetical protein